MVSNWPSKLRCNRIFYVKCIERRFYHLENSGIVFVCLFVFFFVTTKKQSGFLLGSYKEPEKLVWFSPGGAKESPSSFPTVSSQTRYVKKQRNCKFIIRQMWLPFPSKLTLLRIQTKIITKAKKQFIWRKQSKLKHHHTFILVFVAYVTFFLQRNSAWIWAPWRVYWTHRYTLAMLNSAIFFGLSEV